ncbi:hypothetical protein [Lentzea sp. HUAS12]|uniref:hypothetical protein n=1 Tax=Lentzea sp. HUAS12 TaxID=2951806 RepID=UPI0020A15D81|nr:hypothetical protein [Lentzea sp. HUAS12]USX56284.1 hypothetical protein ND450_19930 [Lentzea sp. HUAS12]
MKSDVSPTGTRRRARLASRTILTTLTAMALAAGTAQAQAAPAAADSATHTTTATAHPTDTAATDATSTAVSARAAGLVNLGDHFHSSGGFCHVGKNYRINANSTAQLERFKKVLLNPRNGVPGLRYDFLRTNGTQLELRTYHVLRESYWGIPSGHCSITKVSQHKGRATLALPSWAKGLIAALASAAIFVAIVLGVEAAILAAFPAGAVAATAVAGCVAGSVQNYVYNAIVGVTDKSALIATAVVNCFTGAALGLGLGQVRNIVLNWVKTRAAAQISATASGASGAAINTGVAQTAAALQQVRG